MAHSFPDGAFKQSFLVVNLACLTLLYHDPPGFATMWVQQKNGDTYEH